MVQLRSTLCQHPHPFLQGRRKHTGSCLRAHRLRKARQLCAVDSVALENNRYVRDHLGSVRGWIQVQGGGVAVAGRAFYDAWGRSGYTPETIGATGNWTSAASPAGVGFTGHICVRSGGSINDGLILAPYRAYAPWLGRWLSEDPIEEAGGLNLYGYVGNRVTGRVDPLGYWQLTISGGYGAGGYITIGNNGGGGIFDGQWNFGAAIGVGVGLSVGLDVTDSGKSCFDNPTGLLAKASVSFGTPKAGGYIDVGTNHGVSNMSYGDRLGPFGFGRNEYSTFDFYAARKQFAPNSNPPLYPMSLDIRKWKRLERLRQPSHLPMGIRTTDSAHSQA
jgi:RHS repeat-associated protein